jgi:glyoxylase-like metal-dependent hydrolase (beta-lactamase superfamily II)
MPEKTITCINVGDIATNCWIYPLSETECAVIDPGAEADRIIARLQQLKQVPRYILATHGHFDHIAALPALAAAYGRTGAGGGPVIAVHRLDAEYLGPDSYQVHCESFSAAGGSAAYIDSLWEDMPPPDINLEEGDSAGPFTVLHLPGHTPGSIGLWDQEGKVLFSGDTLFYDGYGRTDLPGGSEARLFESLERLCSLDGEIRVLPGHGQATSIGDEARRLKFI